MPSYRDKLKPISTSTPSYLSKLKPIEQPAPQQNFFERLKSVNKPKIAERQAKVTEAQQAQASGKQGKLSTLFDIGGQSIGASFDTALSAISAATPDAIEEPIKKAGRTIIEPLVKGIGAAGDKIGGTRFMQEAVAGYGPNERLPIERHIESGLEYLNVLPVPKGAAAAGKAAKATALAPDAAARAAGRAVAKATPDVAPFKKSFRPEVAKEFASEGITPPLSAITKSPFVQGAESLAAKSVFGRKIVDRVKSAESAIEKKVNDTINQIRPEKNLSDENLGKTIQEGLREYEHNFKVDEEKIYTAFARTYGSKMVAEDTFDTQTVLKSILEQQGRDYFKGIDPRLQSMFERLTGETPDIKRMRKEGIPESLVQAEKDARVPLLTFDELKATRTSVGEQLARDPENTALKRLYGALSSDMKAAVDSLDPIGEAAANLKMLDATYKSGKQRIESRIAQSIEKSNPERIAQNLITRNSAQTLKTLKEMIGNTRFEEISKAFVRQTLDDAVTRGKFDVDKFKKKIGKYDKDTLNEIMNQNQRADLDIAVAKLEKYQRLRDALSPGKKFYEGSQTAFLQEIRGTGARAAAIFTALATGNVGLAIGIIFGTVGEAVYAKLFTSEFGRKFLTEGFKGANTAKSVGNYLKDVQPGLSTKAVSGIPAEKLDGIRDYLIRELDRHNPRKLNVDIAGEAQELATYLRETPKINPSDVNRSMEVLRLQGNTEAVRDLQKTLTPSTLKNYLRDAQGRFSSESRKP